MTSQPARVVGHHALEPDFAGDIRAVHGLLSACTFLDSAQSGPGPSLGAFFVGVKWKHDLTQETRAFKGCRTSVLESRVCASRGGAGV
jgi:hypothetical protein